MSQPTLPRPSVKRRRGYRHIYTTIKVYVDLKEELDKAMELAYPGVARPHALALILPRCPVCHGLLVHKFASTHLVCVKCGREYELKEVTKP